uniref:Uncharacterized protein n=1 Tax=Oryza glumipatula TaxID=40148 RepID=A0A0D9ZBJ9_9ORYZ
MSRPLVQQVGRPSPPQRVGQAVLARLISGPSPGIIGNGRHTGILRADCANNSCYELPWCEATIAGEKAEQSNILDMVKRYY